MEENEKKCELTLPNGRHIEFSYAKLKAGAAIGALLLAGAVSCAGYFYYQLADYRSEAADFAAYKQNKQEQQTKLQQLVNDNERMLRDMAEISNLEKKLRRAIIRDVDSSKLGEGTSMVDSTTAKETSANTSYTGKGGQGKLDVNGTMAGSSSMVMTSLASMISSLACSLRRQASMAAMDVMCVSPMATAMRQPTAT